MWLMLLRTAVQSLRANTMRSLLAMLGVVIGVAAVVAMLGIGTGAQNSLMSQWGGEGARVLHVYPDWRQVEGHWRAPRPLTLPDAESMMDLPGIEAVAPVARSKFQIRWGAESQTAEVIASTDSYPLMNKVPIGHGRQATVAEHELGAPVCVLGAEIASKLFDGVDPVGETVVVAAMPLQVIGVVRAHGKGGFFNPDEQVQVPLTTARKGILPRGNLDEILVRARSVAELTHAQDGVGELLLRRHRILDAASRDFTLFQNQEVLDQLSRLATVFSALLGGIAAISLLVGGIGIMNIMLVTVTERTREIGLRKALGARERDIRNQFLIESMLTTGCGGAGGVLVGWLLVWLGGMVMPFKPAVDGTSIMLALGFSLGVGLAFGWYPAVRAARLAPIDALRYE